MAAERASGLEALARAEGEARALRRHRGAALALLALLLVGRVLSWRWIGRGPALAPLEAAAGVAADLALVALIAGLRGPRSRAIVASLAILALGLDLASCLAARAHVGPVVWWHLAPEAWRAALGSGIGVWLGALAGLVWLAGRLGRWLRPAPGGRLLVLALALGLALPVAIEPRHLSHAGGVPLVDLPRSLATFAGLRPAPEHRPPDVASRARWAAHGWLPRGSGHRAPPAQRTAAPRAAGVVLVLMESMNAGLSRLYAPDAPLATPALARLAQRGTSVSGYLTQARPTHQALVAALCSLLPGTWPIDQARGRRLPRLPGCLPAAVVAAGGRSALFHGGPLRFTGLDRTARAMGFGRALGQEALPRRSSVGPWGARDADVYEAALRWASAQRDGPFLAVVVTTDGHLPGAPPDDCDAAPDRGPWVRAQACADRALGRFVSRLAARHPDVVIAVSADHAAPDTPEVRAALAQGFGGSFAPLPLVIAGPGVPRARLQRLGGHLDLAATLGARLGLRLPRGRDLLARPGPSRVLLSTMGRRRVGLALPSRRHELPLAELGRACRQGGVVPRALACDAGRFLSALDAAWHTDTLDSALAPTGAPERVDSSRSRRASPQKRSP